MRSPRTLTIMLGAMGALGLLTAGCATTLSADEIAEPKARIAAAEEAGASENPEAALHLNLANDQFERASKLIELGENARAARFLDRASADAELALELAHLDRTRGEARDAMRGIHELRRAHDFEIR